MNTHEAGGDCENSHVCTLCGDRAAGRCEALFLFRSMCLCASLPRPPCRGSRGVGQVDVRLGDRFVVLSHDCLADSRRSAQAATCLLRPRALAVSMVAGLWGCCIEGPVFSELPRYRFGEPRIVAADSMCGERTGGGGSFLPGERVSDAWSSQEVQSCVTSGVHLSCCSFGRIITDNRAGCRILDDVGVPSCYLAPLEVREVALLSSSGFECCL